MPKYRIYAKGLPTMQAIRASSEAKAIQRFEQHLATYPLPNGTPNWQLWGKPTVTSDEYGFIVRYSDIPRKYARVRYRTITATNQHEAIKNSCFGEGWRILRVKHMRP